MTLSVYLHKDRVDVLKMFGNLNDVVNKILDEYDNGKIDIENKPECESRIGASRYNINIRNENYVDMLMSYGIKSKQISLRRLLYWFVDNEIYNELEWEPVNDYIDSNDERINKKIDKIVGEIDALMFIVNDDGTLAHAKDLLLSYKR